MQVCLQKKKTHIHTHTHTHHFTLCQTHLPICMWHHQKAATNQTSEISLSLSLINMSKVTKSRGITYSFRSVPSSTQILNCHKIASSFMRGNAYFWSYLPWFFPPTVCCWPYIVFRFIIEYNSVRATCVIGLFWYEDFWKMIFWLGLKFEISYYRVIISWRILVFFLKRIFWI